MSILDKLNFNVSFGFGGGKGKPSETLPSDKEVEIMNRAMEAFQSREIASPVTAGRSSIAEESHLIPGRFQPVNVRFPFELLKIIENLAIYNGHISQAIENIVTLANTEIETYFSDDVSESQQRKMKAFLKRRRNSWYEHSEGENSMVNDLLTQVATYGCLSAERVIKKDLSGIDKVVRVNPYNIRFVYDDDRNIHIPVQKVPHSTKVNGQLSKKYAGYIELNNETYQYIASKRVGSIPYAIPPFFSALEALVMERDNLDGFRNMIKKMGVLGFLSVLVTAPKQNAGENETSYFNRMLGYLESLRPQVEKGYSTGVALGFKGKHEFNVEGNNMNVQGADGIFKITKSYIFSGVKQDPNMMGENYATTETFGRVILAKTTKQMENYQRIVASFLSQCDYMELVLNGFKPGYVEKVFKKAMIGDQKREEETEKLKIENVTKKRDEGYIDQETAVNELGYDKPAAPGRINLPAPTSAAGAEPQGPENATPNAGGEDTKSSNESVTHASFARMLSQVNDHPRVNFDYYVPEIDADSSSYMSLEFAPTLDSNGFEFGTVSFPDKTLLKYAKAYTKSVSNKKNKTIDKAVIEIQKGLSGLSASDGVDTIRQTTLFHLLRVWRNEFKNSISKEVDDSVSNIYDHYRKDKTVFTDSAGFVAGRKFMSGKGFKFEDNQSCHSLQRRSDSIKLFTVPDAVFGLKDYRALEYAAELDKIYLGKYITDADTMARLTRWIEKRYLDEGNPVNSKQEIKAFTEDFGEKVDLESWKINRIIDTSVNRIKNAANIKYMEQSGVVEFEVVEVNDRLTCPHCQFMDGTVFSVDIASDKFNRAADEGVNSLSEVMPFATSVKIEELRQMSPDELQSKGFDAPVYHPKCRGRCVAVI